MKALYYDKGLAVRELPTPVPPPGEALIRVLAAGICATDREIAAGYMNFTGVPGHEFAGIVEQCSDTRWLGKTVTGEINAGCGRCAWCARGLQRHCPDRTVLGISGRDGAFAQYLCLPAENLVEIPAELSLRQAVFIEPLAAALEILEQVTIPPSGKAAVIGEGKLSQLIAQVFILNGIEFTVFGRSEAKLNLLKRFSIKTSMQPPPPDTFDMVVEASGSPSGWESAVKAVKPRGALILKSTYAEKLKFNPAPLVIKEITLIGSRCGKFPPAVRLLQRKLIDVDILISKVFPFSRILSAFKYSLKPDCLKVIVEFPA